MISSAEQTHKGITLTPKETQLEYIDRTQKYSEQWELIRESTQVGIELKGYWVLTSWNRGDLELQNRVSEWKLSQEIEEREYAFFFPSDF